MHSGHPTETAALQNRYRYLAYLVVRDAIGFYFGIPKFLGSFDREAAVGQFFERNLRALERRKSRPLARQEIERCRRAAERAVTERIALLEEDLKHCREVLFSDNIWLDHLNLDCQFLKLYLGRLPEEVQEELAVVPNWSTRDHSLGRSYINDRFAAELRFS